MTKPLQNPVVSIARYRGEVDETGQTVSVNVPRRRKRRRGWRDVVALTDIQQMLRVELTGSEYRVLLAVMSHVAEKAGIEARTTAAEIAEQLSVSQPFVWTTMKRLRERNIIRSVRRGVFEINPYLMFNGDFDSWNTVTDAWDEPIYERNVDPTTGEIR